MKLFGFGPAALMTFIALSFLGGTLALLGFFADRVGPQPVHRENGQWKEVPHSERPTNRE